GVFQLQDFALHIDCDFARQVAVGHGGGHFGDVTNLVGEVPRHGVDAIREVLPDSADALHFRLAPQRALRADFAGYASHFRSECIELVDHGVDGVLQLQDFALHSHRDLARQVAVGHGGSHFRDVTDLGCQVTGHGVDAIRQVLPDAADSLHLC